MTHTARLALTLLISSIDSACEILIQEEQLSQFSELRHQIGILRLNLLDLKRNLEYPDVE